MTIRISVIHYSSTGKVHALARAVADGAEEGGAEVRFRKVAELAPPEAIDANPAWRLHADATSHVPVATLDDLRWANAFAFGSPTRFGNVAAPVKQFMDTTAGLWRAGELADKPFTAFTSALSEPAGNETALLALYNIAHHWGSIIVPPGYADGVIQAADDNPYGAAHLSGPDDERPDRRLLAAARAQGRRLAMVTAQLLAGRAVTGDGGAQQYPIVEPDNSTVDDWFGQNVARDQEIADRLFAEEDGDLEAAARRFADEARGRETYLAGHRRPLT